MPTYPNVSRSLAEIGGSLYSSLAQRLSHHRGERYPFHVGDTWLEPAEGCRMEDLRVAEHPGMHRYAPPRGLDELRDAVAARVRARSGVETAAENVLISTGATGGLGAIVGAIVEPGDEVLVLSPYWPLLPGIVRCFHGRPVEVPVIGAVDSAQSAVRRVREAATARSVALYLSTPNNPTGRLLPESWIAALVEWATERDLWIVADDVYEDYVYEDRHTFTRALAPDRTFSAHSFSKAFGMAGNRCGYVVGPRALIVELGKVSTHAYYSAPKASQLAALRALDGRGDRWIDRVRPVYRDLGRRAAQRLGLDSPQGSTFLFLDVGNRLDRRGLRGFLEDCADRGLLVAPGPSFGSYPHHIRICFTCAPPEVVDRGVQVLADLLG